MFIIVILHYCTNDSYVINATESLLLTKKNLSNNSALGMFNKSPKCTVRSFSHGGHQCIAPVRAVCTHTGNILAGIQIGGPQCCMEEAPTTKPLCDLSNYSPLLLPADTAA